MTKYEDEELLGTINLSLEVRRGFDGEGQYTVLRYDSAWVRPSTRDDPRSTVELTREMLERLKRQVDDSDVDPDGVLGQAIYALNNLYNEEAPSA